MRLEQSPPFLESQVWDQNTFEILHTSPGFERGQTIHACSEPLDPSLQKENKTFNPYSTCSPWMKHNSNNTNQNSRNRNWPLRVARFFISYPTPPHPQLLSAGCEHINLT